MHPIGRVPLLGQQQGHQQQLQAQAQAALHSLAMQTYVLLAKDHIGSCGMDLPLDHERLRQLAQKSMAAARCYFEGIQQPGEAP